MSDTVIKVENVSKLYRLGETGTGTIGQDVNRWFAKMRGKEDPFALVGEENDRTTKSTCDIVWALKDINFEVKQGEVLGIIGRNGAGKSTLLKLLSKVTVPSSGSIKFKGRIASLLEVGTGFHPDLTGRENVFLNGAILGMTKKEIQKKFDEIVDFSEVERYIDTPVKRYSSGMYVRLAFAVAAHLEFEILIIDEVLAVGDGEFQKKCLQRMKDVSINDGRTVLFVSHSLGAISQLCTKGILLNNGSLTSAGEVNTILSLYTNNKNSINGIYIKENFSSSIKIGIKRIEVVDKYNKYKPEFNHTDSIFIKIKLLFQEYDESASLFVTVMDNLKRRVFSAECSLEQKKDLYTLELEPDFLAKGIYTLHVFTHLPGILRFDEVEDVCQFSIIDLGSPFVIHGGYDHGVVFGKFNWG